MAMATHLRGLCLASVLFLPRRDDGRERHCEPSDAFHRELRLLRHLSSELLAPVGDRRLPDSDPHSCAMRLASGFHGRSERTGCPRVSEPGERRREPTSRAPRASHPVAPASRGARSDHAERRHDWSALRAKKTSEALTHIAPSKCLSVARALSEARWARRRRVRLRVPRLGSIREGQRRDVRASPSRDRSHRARVRASAGHVRGRPLCRHSVHANISIPPTRVLSFHRRSPPCLRRATSSPRRWAAWASPTSA